DCDDGNVLSGDCCSTSCLYEAPGATCGGDGNGCTDDVCDGGGTCTHPNNTAPCSDGVFCNGPDTCSLGACTVHAGDPCAGGPQCAHTCNESVDSCNDPDGTPCNDANTCTSGETCAAGTCAGGTVTTCPLCEACDGLGGCLQAPRTGCLVPI